MDLEAASVIKPHERDFPLRLHNEDWGSRPIAGWEWGHGLNAHEAASTTNKPFCHYRDIEFPTPSQAELREYLLRWPSAPVYGLNRKWRYEVTLDRGNFFTLRVLRGKDRAVEGFASQRLYFVHNGLNEVDNFRFYYQLASHLISANPNAAVVIVPSPGHLSRYPIPSGYGELPLERYLSDPGDLFRQYVRSLYELEWIFAALAPEKLPRDLCGLYPHGLSEDYRFRQSGGSGDLDAGALHNANLHPRAQRILADFLILHELSYRAVLPSLEKDAFGESAEPAQIAADVERLRYSVYGRYSLSDNDKVRGHSIGYSLGGFVAQSALFNWPSWIAGCTAICSGGPLSSIRLEKFAHPSEWDAVLQGLRYEIPNSLLKRAAAASDSTIEMNLPEGTVTAQSLSCEVNTVAGLPAARFRPFLRSFFEVLLQDSTGSYAQRLEEYVDRVLFVVGGEDPIIKPETVLAAGPATGHNFLQVAHLSHFVNQADQEFELHWLPRIAFLVDLIATRSEQHLQSPANTRVLKESRLPKPRRESDETLTSARFSEEVIQIIKSLTSSSSDGVERAGHLWLSQSMPPTILFPSEAARHEAVRLHYNSVDAQVFAGRWGDLSERLLAQQHQLTAVVSFLGSKLFAEDPEPVPRYSVVVDGMLPVRDTFLSILRETERRWLKPGGRGESDALRYFVLEDESDFFLNGAPLDQSDGAGSSVLSAAKALVHEIQKCSYARDSIDTQTTLGEDASKRFPVTNVVPDSWIFVSPDALDQVRSIETLPRPSGDSRAALEAWFLEWALNLYREGWDEGTHRWEQRKAQKQPVFSMTWKWLRDGEVTILRMSRSRSDSQFRGSRLRSPRLFADVWIRAALAYCYSWPAGDTNSDLGFGPHRATSAPNGAARS